MTSQKHLASSNSLCINLTIIYLDTTQQNANGNISGRGVENKKGKRTSFTWGDLLPSTAGSYINFALYIKGLLFLHA